MTMTEAAPATTPPPELSMAGWNGHFRTQGQGNNVFRGELKNLPMPAGPVSIPDAISAMYEDGYVIFPGVLSRDEAALLRARMDAMGGPDEEYVVPKWCFNKHIVSDFQHNPDMLDYIDRPGVIEVAEAIHKIPSWGNSYLVTGGSNWITGKGREMGVHVDLQPICLPEAVHDDPSVRVPIFTSTAHFYLNDMRAELGPTTVVPGSHKAGRAPNGDPSFRGVQPQAVMVKAGDVMLFRGDIWHGAWMNSADEKRYMLQVHYGAGFMQRGYQAMANEKEWSPEVIVKATPRQKMLLGGGKIKQGY